ncbi:MAG: DUF5103 domain-containing protein [Cryomorphaceae bacterium]
MCQFSKLNVLLIALIVALPIIAPAQEPDSTDTKKTKKELRKEKREKRRAQREKELKELEAETAYYEEDFVDLETKIYDDKIKTLILHTTSSELQLPVINLNSDDQLVLRFDDLGENSRDMYYTFEHCSHDWEPSGLSKMDFIDGYNQDIINDFEFSFNTVHKYTNYKLEFPNSRVNLTRSGNYVIKVFTGGSEENVVLTARFMIVEPLTNISSDIKPSRVVSERDYRQEVDIEVNLQGLNVLNPYNDIELAVMQNFRWDDVRTNLKPSFVKDNILVYDYQGPITFDGTNEFRFFDAKSARYRSEKVQDVVLKDNGYHVYLSPDVPRAFMNYSFEQDINGKYIVKNDDMIYPHLESDYFHIHFTMPVDAPLGTGDMYIFGQVSNWKLKKEFRLDYNPEAMAYQKTIKLKQGLYNYMYLWQGKNQKKGSTDLTEGNHSNAENEYMIFVYFKDRSLFYDRLVGYKKVSNYEEKN